MSRVASPLPIAAAACLGLFLAGCGGSSGANGACGTHQYSYVGGGVGISGGAAWYNGYSDSGWYDPGDDGSDYGDEAAGASGSGSGSGDDGSGDDGSYSSGDDGSGDNGSDDSTDDGSSDDGSDDGSGDDGTASKKHLHTANAKLHAAGVTAATPHAACYAYSCDLICAVGSPAVQEREAMGYSASSMTDACQTAAHGVETWAHDSMGSNVSACKQVVAGDSANASSPSSGSRAPASPSVNEGFSATPSSPSSPRSTGTTRIPR